MNAKKILLIAIPVLVLALVICLVLLLPKQDGGEGNGKTNVDSSTDGSGQSGDSQTGDDGDLQPGDILLDDDSDEDPQPDEQQTQTQQPSGNDNQTGGENTTPDPKPDPKPDDGGNTSSPPAVDVVKPEKLSYEEYHAMTPTNQRLYMESFNDPEAFFNWYNAAYEKYLKDHPAIDVGNGSVDIGDLIG